MCGDCERAGDDAENRRQPGGEPRAEFSFAETRTCSEKPKHGRGDQSVTNHGGDDAKGECTNAERGDGERLAERNGDNGQQSAEPTQREQSAERGGEASLTVAVRFARKKMKMEMPMCVRALLAARGVNVLVRMGVGMEANLAECERGQHHDSGKEEQRSRSNVEPRLPYLRQ